MRTLTETVRCRRVIATADNITVQLWREDLLPELPPDLEQALLDAEAEAEASEEARRAWEADVASLRAYVHRLEAASSRLRHKRRHGPLWAAAAASFALPRVEDSLASARDSLSWASQEAQEAARRALDARRALREIRDRAEGATRIRRLRGRTYTVRLRRVNGELIPVDADRPDAVPAAVGAARAWLRARATPTVDPEIARWALDQELRRAAEAQQPLDRVGQEDEFDSFGPDWHWEEELRRREAADRVLSSHGGLDRLAEFAAPVLVILQRDNALQGRAWEVAADWLREVIPQLVARGIRDFRVPGTRRGRQAAELIREFGGTPVVFSVPPSGTDDDLEAAYKAALQTAGGLILVAGSAAAGGTPLYLLDPALAAAADVAPLVTYRWSDGRPVEAREPALVRRVPWVRFDVAAALATAPEPDPS